MAKETNESLAQKVYDHLKKNRIGIETTTSDALAEVIGESVLMSETLDLWAIDDALYKLMTKERKYVMDSGEYLDCCIGLPFNCPFRLRPRWAKSPAWKIRIPYFNTGAEYYQWIADIPEGLMPDAYKTYFSNIYHSAQNMGYDFPIPLKKVERALRHSQRTGEMIDIVPDAGQKGKCDGWTYHIEYISMREYFTREYSTQKKIDPSLPPMEEWVDAMVNHPNEMC